MPAKVLDQSADLGLTARDPQRLLPFYRDYLGLPVAEERHYPAQGASLWFLRVGGGHLKIVAFEKVPAAANPPGGNTAATGFRYVTLFVDDVEAALEGLEDAGGQLQRPPATHGDSRVAFVEDPEGNCIELVQRLAG